MPNFFPLFVDLSHRKIVVIGGGKIATRRIGTLLNFVQKFVVIAKDFSSELLEKSDLLQLIQKPFDFSDLEGLTSQDLVLALTNNDMLNQDIALWCKERNILVNISTNKALCSFYFPGIATHGGIVTGITANGQNHKKARYMRERIEEAMKKEIVIGTRESKLAVIQSEMVLDFIHAQKLDAKLLPMKTTGDIILDRTLDKIGGKGLFTKELDKALLDHRSDLSVHSLKDVPMEIPKDFPLIGYSKREDPRDVLILPDGVDTLDFTKPIGCSSFRRVLQLKTLYPQAQFCPIRGNVITRLEKLDRGEYGALVLAAAGVKRLNLSHRISKYFDPKEILPAAGQGIVAIQGRLNDNYAYLDGFFDQDAFYMATAERAFVKTLDGGCSSPIAAFSTLSNGQISLEGLYYIEATDTFFKETMTMDVEDSEKLGITLANNMKSKANGCTIKSNGEV